MDRDFTIMLLRMLFSIAWSDGDFDGEEAEMLRDYLDDSNVLTDDDKKELTRYFIQPYSESRQTDVFKTLKKHIKTQEQVHQVIYSVRKMICADGDVDEHEQRLYESIRAELREVSIALRKVNAPKSTGSASR